MKKIWIIIPIVLVLIQIVLAFSGSSTSYKLKYGIIGLGQGNGESTSYKVKYAMPDQPVGLFQSSNYKLYLGHYHIRYPPEVLPVSLTLSPDSIWAEKTVTADISCSVNCGGKTAYVGRGEKKVTVCSCVATIGGCSCTFAAPKLTTTELVETYYARIDLDGNKIYNETETASDDLTIYCKAAGESCSSTETCCAGAYCSSGTCKYPSGPGGPGARPK